MSSPAVQSFGPVTNAVFIVAKGATNIITGPVAKVAFVSLDIAKDLTLGNYIEKGYVLKESAVNKLWGLAKWATGISNVKDAHKSLKKDRYDIEDNNLGVIKVEKREASKFERAKDAVSDLLIGSIKLGTWGVLGMGASCKIGPALGAVSQCNSSAAALTERVFDVATAVLATTAQGAAFVLKEGSELVIPMAKEIINDPLPILGGLFVGNTVWSGVNNITSAFETDQSSTAAVLEFALGSVQLGIAGLAGAALIR